jgi:hypothetical protein
MTNKEINDLIIGPVSTIDFLITKLNDENLIQTTEYIKYILSVRTVSKKTFMV